MAKLQLRAARRLLTILGLLAAFTGGYILRAQSPAPPAAPQEVHARGDIAGNWQGTLEMGQSMRTVLKVTKADKGWAGKLYLFTEQGARPLNTSAPTLDGSTFKFSVELMGVSYVGTISADGNSITGTLTGGPKPQPLTFVRATKETAWEIPAPPPPPKLMAADSDPSFEVATIKPNNSGKDRMQGLTVRGRNFATRNSSLGDLIAFAFDIQQKQIIDGPDWMNKDRYDLDGLPDQPGEPNEAQCRTMVRKLLIDRFQLKFHRDQRELPAFVLSEGKTAEKLKPTQLSGPLPGMGLRPVPGGVTLMMMNATVSDFTEFLQMLVLDRPVVNRTGIQGRFDYQVKFTPDDSQFDGHPPKLPATTDATDSAPSLSEAISQQLGLKLTAEKTSVDVVVIDHVEKPSAN